MDIQTLLALLAVVGSLSGIVLGWLGKARSFKKDAASDASQDTAIKMDVEYIKRGVDEIRLEQKDQGRRIDGLAERATRVEESTKQAHHRINRLEGDGK